MSVTWPYVWLVGLTGIHRTGYCRGTGFVLRVPSSALSQKASEVIVISIKKCYFRYCHFDYNCSHDYYGYCCYCQSSLLAGDMCPEPPSSGLAFQALTIPLHPNTSCIIHLSSTGEMRV